MLIRVTPEELIGATESIIELETIARMAQEKASQLKNMPISPEEVHFIQKGEMIAAIKSFHNRNGTTLMAAKSVCDWHAQFLKA